MPSTSSPGPFVVRQTPQPPAAPRDGRKLENPSSSPLPQEGKGVSPQPPRGREDLESSQWSAPPSSRKRAQERHQPGKGPTATCPAPPPPPPPPLAETSSSSSSSEVARAGAMGPEEREAQSGQPKGRCLKRSRGGKVRPTIINNNNDDDGLKNKRPV